MVNDLIHTEALFIDSRELLSDLDDISGEPLNAAIQLKCRLVDLLLEVAFHFKLVETLLDHAYRVNSVENARVKVRVEPHDVGSEVLRLVLAEARKRRFDRLIYAVDSFFVVLNQLRDHSHFVKLLLHVVMHLLEPSVDVVIRLIRNVRGRSSLHR